MASRLVLLRLASNKTAASTCRIQSQPSRFFAAQVRQTVTKEERAALRAARRERAAEMLQKEKQGAGVAGEASETGGTGSSTKQFLASRYIWYLSVGVPSVLLAWGLSDEESPPAKFSQMTGFSGLIHSFTDEIARPSHNKLLPDWSQLPNVPHDIPVPHTLVLDLENTLVSSTWDRKYGWRHAKRPGVDKFLMRLAQHYEIVLYSPSIDAIADPVVTSLDKSGCIMHRLYRDATYYSNGIHVKDLNRLNRNVKRMIVLDDDPAEVQFNPENHIKIKPYTDPTDRSDNTLERITPFLVEIARENHDDIPALLAQYQGMDADEIADEQERRINYIQDTQKARSSRGLSGIAKSARKPMDMEPEFEARKGQFTSPGLTSKDLVGAPPPPAGSDKGIMGFLNRRQQEKEENERRKIEKWNEVMLKKHKEKAEATAN